ncbi:unnamed protein product [Anisakis simplex]|uniref:Reticulon-4-interacting protein 1, mitochondrial (inferred by orthology to a human protein) n=1 Tax=Anisakis simplex TaxID=6269 RepID=A0A0M3KGV5_ANISI|nr:unnamed protein product [Anisakis simplex]
MSKYLNNAYIIWCMSKLDSSLKRLSKKIQVMGIVAPTWTGAHAEYVLSKESWCVKKPNNISHVQAAALPYVACTVWAALVSVSGLSNVSSRHQFSIDSDFVYCNYSEKNRKDTNRDENFTHEPIFFELVSSLGAKPVDYDCMTVKEMLQSEGPFDVILDCVNTELAQWSDSLMGVWRNSVHVTLLTPILQDTDSRYEMAAGSLMPISHRMKNVSIQCRN